jgi:hypothetical protein
METVARQMHQLNYNNWNGGVFYSVRESTYKEDNLGDLRVVSCQLTES